MAHIKKGAGSTPNGRDSNAQRLGVKRFGGEKLSQKYSCSSPRYKKFYPGENVGIGVMIHSLLLLMALSIQSSWKNKAINFRN